MGILLMILQLHSFSSDASSDNATSKHTNVRESGSDDTFYDALENEDSNSFVPFAPAQQWQCLGQTPFHVFVPGFAAPGLAAPAQPQVLRPGRQCLRGGPFHWFTQQLQLRRWIHEHG